ncbi:MAG TPA: molybdopterin molybdotransferase MoeA [Pyrinomonadaceae bacterium]|nr:molybdopterin molybdotransferase MoeA [Pyrinomonadaceae bacterium]
MIPIPEAIKIIKRETPVLSSETIEIENSINRILAEIVKADMDLPPFDRSQMDGFAVRVEDVKNVPAHLRIIGESVAGAGFDRKLKSGEALRIMTGARVPEGANAVQKVELTRENYGFVEILEKPEIGQNINKRASEIKKGTKIFGKGERITEQMIAAIASFGYEKLKVFSKPQVKIISTGSEIVEISETPKKDQIRNSNSMMLKILTEKAGAESEILPHVRDNYEILKHKIAEAVGIGAEIPISSFKIKSKIQNPKSKILIITGGVSIGDYDFTKPVLRELGAEIFFEKVSLKPGKPTVFARLNDVLIFGLPGNPVSVAVTHYLFVRTAILQMQTAKTSELKSGFAICSDKIKSAKERDCFLPVSLSTNKKGQLVIEFLRFSGSSNFIAFSRADALVFVPQGKDLEKGKVAEILFL